MNPEKFKKTYSSVLLKKPNATRLRILKKRLGYPSIDAVVAAFLDLRDAMGWDSFDIATLTKYKKLPDVEVKTVQSEKQMLKNEDLDKPEAHRTFEQTMNLNKKEKSQ